MRLIDADALTSVTEMVNGEWKTYYEKFEIDNAPTVVPKISSIQLENTFIFGVQYETDETPTQNQHVESVGTNRDCVCDCVECDCVEVVRCANCKECEERLTANYLPFLYCRLNEHSVSWDAYCVWGREKR